MKFIYQFFSFIQHCSVYFRIKIFQRRFFVLKTTGKKVEIKKNPEKIIIIIAHVVPNAKNEVEGKLGRLTACLNALFKSLALFEFKIILLTKEGFSLHQYLPEYLKHKTEVYYSQQQDPMFVEYNAHDVFKLHVNAYDYFLFLEDDIILNDSWFLEKIKNFNDASPKNNFVLLPHRFEYYIGLKYYFEQSVLIKDTLQPHKYLEQLTIISGGIKFSIYENPHAAFYCLNKEQMQLWINSGYKWKNKVVAFGALESAATFCLYENFQFFNPHPDNISYFEVQHYGNKYMLNNKFISKGNE